MNEIASRYAQALVSIAKEENKFSNYKLAVLDMQEVLVDNNDLFCFLKSYFVKNEDKFKIVSELTKKYELENFTNFLNLLIQKHKIHIYKDIVKEIVKLLNYEMDIYEGFVYSTEPLENSKIIEISEAISKKLGRKVELKNKVDERLIGGVKVVVHDHVFDGSIKHKLETMKEQLKERRNEK